MSGAIFCLSLYHVCPAHSRKSVGSAGLHFGVLSEEYPVWNDFLTFSTGFSTDFVKKKWGFPQCFPLFPPSFPQKIELWVIHDVFQNGKRGKIWGEKRSQSLFLKRKSRPKIYFLRRFALGAKKELDGGCPVAKDRVGEDSKVLKFDIIGGVPDPSSTACGRVFPEFFITAYNREAVHFGAVGGNEGIHFHGVADRGDGGVDISKMAVGKVVRG